MQRRAMSSNPKRMPKNLRRKHISDYESQPKITKRPLGKYRKRATKLVDDYLRRQQLESNTWLETHVWHAKRFHMVKKFGYSLPSRPTQKMYRPLLRAIKERCTIQVLCAVLLMFCQSLINQ